jgi:hypothetical protein
VPCLLFAVGLVIRLPIEKHELLRREAQPSNPAGCRM